MTRIQIYCPSCSKKGEIEISKETIKNSMRGLLAVNIVKDIICDHSFIVYIDTNLNVRDYFIADFQIDLPKLAPQKVIEEKSLPSKDVINLDLIKINLSANLLTYVLKSIFSKQKILIIYDQKFLYDHIIKYFQYLTQDSFDIDISVISEETYKENKKKYKDSMVFESNQIIQNVKKVIDPKKLNVEKQIIKNFLSEYDLAYSIIVLKNEILKAYELAKSVVEYAEIYKKESASNLEKNFKDTAMANFVDEIFNKEKFISKIINDYLVKTYNIKFNKHYLEFILEIVEKYFKVDIEKKIKI